MKRFLIFCIIIIVCVAIGFMCVFFLKDNESLEAKNSIFTINVGESRVLDFEHIKPKSTTKITYEISDTDVVGFDEKTRKITAKKGGSATITVRASNQNINPLLIEVNAGDGTVDYPYYIRTATDLATIGVQTSTESNILPFRLQDSYMLVANIELGNTWTPIKGEFEGVLYGEGYTISNLNINTTTTNAGLFEKIGKSGVVQYLNFNNINISGSYNNAGVVAGVNHGNIINIDIANAEITNNAVDSNTGAVVGVNGTNDEGIAQISKVAVLASIVASGNAGGITGLNQGGYIYNCYTKESTTIAGMANGAVGGISGINRENNNDYSIIKDCYSLATVTNTSVNLGAITGLHNYDADKDPRVINLVIGCYYLAPTEGEMIGVYGYLDINANTSLADQFAKGIMGVEGKTIAELRAQTTFVSHISTISGSVVVWDFNESWHMDNNNTPSIFREGVNLRISLSSINIGGENILQAQDLSELDMDGKYYVKQDIDLGGEEWTPLGSEVNGFRGLLSGVWLEEEQRYTKISNFVLPYGGNVGFFNTIGGGEVCNLIFENISTTDNGDNGIDAVNFGMIAGLNQQGYIHDITIQGENNCIINGVNKGVSVGGCVGVNKGIITKVIVEAGLLKNIVAVDVPTYVGGIAGTNYGSVTFCALTSGEVVRNSTFFGANGGIVGLNSKLIDANSGVVSSNYVVNAAVISSMSYLGPKYNDTFAGHLTGGIVGDHRGTKVNYNTFAAEVSGFAVGGIVGFVRGEVFENRTTIDMIAKGCLVGGCAVYQQGKTEDHCDIHDNSIEGTLMGVEYSGTAVNNQALYFGGTLKCGIVVASVKFGGYDFTYMYNNFVSVSFAGEGLNMHDHNCKISFESVRRNNNIFNSTKVKNLYFHWYFDTIYEFFFEDIYAPLEGSFSETWGTEEELKASYKKFKSCKFSDMIWNLDNTTGDFPTLYNAVEIPPITASAE